ncbi:MAG: GNAT family N-acetyltransferase [Suipraeoptans sp.]
MQIQHIEEKEMFELLSDEGNPAGEMDYRVANPHLIYATHTEIYKGFEGKGYGGVLLEALVKWARDNGKKIYPTCPYVVRAFDKEPEKYVDLDARL